MRAGAPPWAGRRCAVADTAADRWSRTAGARSPTTSIRSSLGVAASVGSATASITITTTRRRILSDVRRVRSRCPAGRQRGVLSLGQHPPRGEGEDETNRARVTFLAGGPLVYNRPVLRRRHDLHPTAARKRKEAHA